MIDTATLALIIAGASAIFNGFISVLQHIKHASCCCFESDCFKENNGESKPLKE